MQVDTSRIASAVNQDGCQNVLALLMLIFLICLSCLPAQARRACFV